MFRKINVPLLGIVKNTSHYDCRHVVMRSKFLDRRAL